MRFGTSGTPAQYRSVWLHVMTTMCSGTASTVVPLGTSPTLPWSFTYFDERSVSRVCVGPTSRLGAIFFFLFGVLTR